LRKSLASETIDTIKDHTQREKQLIKDFGGEPRQSFGVDGFIGDEPVEVRLAKKDDRFRLNKETHEDLLEQDGSYIFDDLSDNQPPKEVEADQIDEQLTDNYHSDRGYEHQFIPVDSIF